MEWDKPRDVIEFQIPAVIHSSQLDEMLEIRINSMG